MMNLAPASLYCRKYSVSGIVGCPGPRKCTRTRPQWKVSGIPFTLVLRPSSSVNKAPQACHKRAAECVSGATRPPMYCTVASSASSSIKPTLMRPAQLTHVQWLPKISNPIVLREPATQMSTTAHFTFQARDHAVCQNAAAGGLGE
eukprot:1032896-Amphidinium_carterae.2